MKFFQYPKGLLTEPGFIPEFKGVAEVLRAGQGGEENAKFFQPLSLKFESWRKLPQQDSQLLFQRGGIFQKELKGFPEIL